MGRGKESERETHAGTVVDHERGVVLGHSESADELESQCWARGGIARWLCGAWAEEAVRCEGGLRRHANQGVSPEAVSGEIQPPSPSSRDAAVVPAPLHLAEHLARSAPAPAHPS